MAKTTSKPKRSQAKTRRTAKVAPLKVQVQDVKPEGPPVEMEVKRPGGNEVAVSIYSGERPEDQSPVEVTVNGYKFTMQRDVVHRVPRAVLNVLMVARTDKMVRVAPNAGFDTLPANQPVGVWKERGIPRFHYQYRDLTDEELANPELPIVI